MRFGTAIPTCWEGGFAPAPFAGPKEIIQLIQMAERLGFDSVWGIDRINPSRGMPGEQMPNWYEVLISLAYAAAVTERIGLGVGVIILPLREPVILAKQVATLDRFSDGRFLLGVGLGTSREEFESVGGKDRKGNRGEMMDEELEVLNLLLTRNDVSFQGHFFELQGVSLNPKPVQRPFPIYISGNAPDTLARVARWGTGWMHSSHTAKEALRQRVDKLALLLEAQGRDLSQIDVVVGEVQSLARTHEAAVERFLKSRVANRRKGRDMETFAAENFIGTPEEIAEKIYHLEKDGATHCVGVHIAADTFEELKEQVQVFGEEVVPLVRKV